MSGTGTDPFVFVIFGATGDLAHRKLLPVLARLGTSGALGERTLVLGVGRKELDDGTFRAQVRETLDEKTAGWCDRGVYYHRLEAGSPDEYRGLRERLESLERDRALPGNRVHYLSLPPGTFPETVAALGGAGLNRSRGWTRLVVEKPFGRDLVSARKLNALVHEHFDESQVYRIDHYLGKETVQNLLVFRFSNAVFESLWNRDRIDSVQITVAEDLGIEGRAGYYDRAGALRDMVQSHLTQLLTLVGMEVPVAFEAAAIRQEKIKVLRSIVAPEKAHLVTGQYQAGTIDTREVPGYLDEPGVPEGSRTETFAALRLELDTWRWKGVPFYLRTGKRLPRRLTRISVRFKEAPVCLFQTLGGCEIQSNVLHITLQPDEGFSLLVQVKKLRQPFALETLPLAFRYRDAFGPLPEAYETLLLDVVNGDQTLFVHADEAELAWRLYDPRIRDRRTPRPYAAGTWGPAEADALLQKDGRQWLA